jgi:hypothetical protein
MSKEEHEMLMNASGVLNFYVRIVYNVCVMSLKVDIILLFVYKQ